MAEIKPKSIKSDYLSGGAGEPETPLRQFHHYPFPLQDYSAVIRDKALDNTDRSTLADELLRQNRDLPDNAATLANIEALRDENTFTVTTGHQLVMMGGPMYTLYKIAHTIRLAEAMQKQQADHRIVPVFWMATEDHDWEEINHFYPAFGKKRVYPGSFRGPVGRHVLEDSIAETLAEVDGELSAFFEPGKKYAEAFRAFIHHLFGHTGLVIIDADFAVLKRLFVPAMRRELMGEGMADHIARTDSELESCGYKQQIFARPVNLFYLGDGDRDLIHRAEDGSFSLKEKPQTWTSDEMLALLEAHPEDFSPNVAARPLYQEIILPNLAYIGGWAEMSYWMQLKGAFEAAEVNFPMLVPRMSATMITRTQASAIAALAFQPEDMARPLHELKKLHLMNNWSDAELLDANAKVYHSFDGLIAYLEGVDPTLAIHIRAQQAKTNKILKKLEKKVHKSLRNQNHQPYDEIEALKAAISPDRSQQQRVLNLTAFTDSDNYRIGAQRLAQLILDECIPETYQEQWITLP